MNYIRIDKDNMVNGPGIRTVLWVSGCEHKCKNCHNPETWSFSAGQLFTKEALSEIRETLLNDYITGLTITGGDPLNHRNILDVLTLCKKIKTEFPNKSIWVYTGGDFEEYIKSDTDTVYHEILNYIDVIIDGEFIESLKDVNLKWRGSSNQRLINVKESIDKNTVVLLES